MSAVLQPGAVEIRDMTRADVARVHAIEQLSYPYPWSLGIFRDCLQAGYFCRVMALPGAVIVGYVVMSVSAAEAHILNLCIAEAHRRGGLGRQLLDHLVGAARRRGAERLFLEVRPSNPAARRLYAGAGFRQVGVRRHYYPAGDGREDALILARDLTGAGAETTA